MNLDITKKTISLILVFSVLITTSFTFLLFPKKSQATWPVLDYMGLIQSIFKLIYTIYSWITGYLSLAQQYLQTAYQYYMKYYTYWLVFKEQYLDPSIWKNTKNSLKNLISGITGWVGGSGTGKPQFIKNVNDFLQGARVNALGIFNDALAQANICPPFQSQIKTYFNNPQNTILSSQLTNSAKTGAIDCTLEETVGGGNISNYYNDFSYGGWDAWLSSTVERQNNAFGATLVAYDNYAAQQAAEVPAAETQIKMNNGFLSVKNCLVQSQPSGACLKYEITTPGAAIKDYLSEAVASQFRQLEIIDEYKEDATMAINEILDMFKNGLSISI